ncbi:MAG: hypothetical protein ACXQTW_06685, partial [Candidatus Methanospirareceae archaeon]
MDKGMKEIYDGIKRVITISERIEGHTKDIAEIKGRAGAMEGRLDSVERQLYSVGERLDSLETGQKEIRTDVRAIRDRLELKDEIYAMKER